MKSRFLIVAIFFTFLLQINAEEQTLSSSSFTCGRQSNDQSSWNVAVYHTGLLGLRSPTSEIQIKIPQYKCSGTLINADTVLTAAHCVTRYHESLSRENVVVSLGKQNLSESSSLKFLKAVNLMQHPNYSHVDLSNDIAIIKLSAEVTFSDHVQPICLWGSNRTELTEVMGKMGTVVGWGKTETGSLLETLQQVNMTVEDSLICLESDRSTFGGFMSKNTFCAGVRNGLFMRSALYGATVCLNDLFLGTSACISDTGGSLTFEENGISYIRGIVTLFKFDKTAEMCDPDEYTLFTDVAHHLPWIAEVAAWKCEKRVSCVWGVRIDDCLINLNITLAERNCKVIAENALADPHDKVWKVIITGNVEVLPDLTNVFDIFEDMFILIVQNEANSKLTIERKQLFAARRISMLRLEGNRIEEIEPDTFEDLGQLIDIDLNDNCLKMIHRDTFRALYKLEFVWLHRNNLEVLPEGLFRNNHVLKMAVFSSNNLKIIATDFRNLGKLFHLSLKGNECINKDYDLSSYTLTEFQTKIWNQCKG